MLHVFPPFPTTTLTDHTRPSAAREHPAYTARCPPWTAPGLCGSLPLPPSASPLLLLENGCRTETLLSRRAALRPALVSLLASRCCLHYVISIVARQACRAVCLCAGGRWRIAHPSLATPTFPFQRTSPPCTSPLIYLLGGRTCVC